MQPQVKQTASPSSYGRLQTAILKHYNTYEPLAIEYAAKIFNSEYTGMEIEDIAQDLRIRIFTSVITYGEKWGDYKKIIAGGGYAPKPIDIQYYIRSALANKVKDYIKRLGSETKQDVRWETIDNMDRKNIDLRYTKTHRNIDYSEKVAIDSDTFDMGLMDTMDSTLERNPLGKDIMIINGVDLLQGLDKHFERKCFVLYLTGVDKDQLQAIYSNKGINAKHIIKTQLKKLRSKKDELLNYTKQTMVVHTFE